MFYVKFTIGVIKAKGKEKSLIVALGFLQKWLI